jgi:hypothetical protein
MGLEEQPEPEEALEEESVPEQEEGLEEEAVPEQEEGLEAELVADLEEAEALEEDVPEHGPGRDRELEEELLPAQLEEVSLPQREPVRVASAVTALMLLGCAAGGFAAKSRWAFGFAVGSVAVALGGELARRYVTPVAAPDLPMRPAADHAAMSRTARYPRRLPRRYRRHWSRPWRRRARRSVGFRRWLRRHGYFSPHFRIAETVSRRDRCGCRARRPPRRLYRRWHNYCFMLERLRHRLGDRPMPAISFYRTRCHNRCVGGARFSQHMKAAGDFSRQWVNRMGRRRVLYHGNIVFRRGGMGIYPGGNVHFDNRGWRARWSSWVRTRVSLLPNPAVPNTADLDLSEELEEFVPDQDDLEE